MAPPQNNKQTERLGTLRFDPGGSDDLTIRPQAAPIFGFLLTISGTLANANTSSNASQNDLGVAKLIRQLTMDFDGTDYVSATGPDLFELQYPFLSGDGPDLDRADLSVASDDFGGNIFIPLMPQRILADPFKKVHWPGLAVPRSGFRLEAEFEGATANSNSDAGTGALGSGGTDAYSFSSDPDVEVHVVYNDLPRAAMVGKNGKSRFPAFAPRIRTFTSEQIAAGSTPEDFSTSIPGRDALMLLMQRELDGSGVTQTAEDLVDDIRVAHDDQELPEVTKKAFQERIVHEYEGVGRSADAHDAPRSRTYIPFAGDGKIGGILPLSQLNDPTVTVDVVNGPSGSGRLRYVKYGLVEIEGATAGETVR